VRTSVELLRVHSLPPLASAVRLRQDTIVGHALQRTGGIAAIADRHELLPYPAGCAMNGDSEPEPLRAGNFFPGADDILSRSDIDAIPRLVFRVPAIEVSMVIGECDEIFGPGPGVEPNQFRGVPVLRPPDMTDVFVPELRRV